MLKIYISLDVITFISCILFIADDVIITDECYYSITLNSTIEERAELYFVLVNINLHITISS